jgi:DNA polymerase-1
LQRTETEGPNLALLHERRAESPGAVPILAVHDEIVVECAEGDAEEVEAWLKKAMLDGMDEVVNASGAGGPRVPVGVEGTSGKRPGPGR